MKRSIDEEEQNNKVVGSNPRELDQFFTKPEVALKCVELVKSFIKIDFDMVLEPSFGNGAFLSALIDVGIPKDKITFIDIDACDINHKADFLLEFNPPPRDKVKCLTIGNPPFGKNSSLAISFFNRAAEFSNCIAFIVPRTFSKKSVQNRLNLSFFLIYEYILEKDGFLFNNKTYSVPCVFQIWVYSDSKIREIPKKVLETRDFKFVKRSLCPDLAIRRVGVNAGMLFENELDNRSEQSHFFIRVKDKERKSEIIKNLKLLNLENTKSKFQTAGNPSISKTELCNLYIDLFNNN